MMLRTSSCADFADIQKEQLKQFSIFLGWFPDLMQISKSDPSLKDILSLKPWIFDASKKGLWTQQWEVKMTQVGDWSVSELWRNFNC